MLLHFAPKWGYIVYGQPRADDRWLIKIGVEIAVIHEDNISG